MFGYDGARLGAELKPLHTIANENSDNMQLDYTLYEVIRKQHPDERKPRPLRLRGRRGGGGLAGRFSAADRLRAGRC